MGKRKPYFSKAVDEMRLRLNDHSQWFPMPALIGFGLAAVLTSHLLPGLNPRLGHPARLIQFPAEPEYDGAIWLSVSINTDTNELLISTSDRKLLRFDASVQTMEDFKPLVQYLKDSVHSRLASAALARSLTTTEITAVLAVDETVKYGLVRPVVNALAMAGITDYAFETIMTREL